MWRPLSVLVTVLVLASGVAAQAPLPIPSQGMPPASQGVPPPQGQPGQPGPPGPPAPLPLPSTPTPTPPAQDLTGDGGVESFFAWVRNVSETQSALTPGSVNPPANWEQYVDRTNPQVRVNYPPDWLVRAAVGPPMMMGVSNYANLNVSSPDRYHYLEGSSALDNRTMSPESITDQLLQRYSGSLPFRRIMKRQSWSPQLRYSGDTARLYHFRAIEAGSYVVVAVAVANRFGAYGTGGIYQHRLIIGPTNTFTRMMHELYLPMVVSMLGW
jgi:hypothetical protein